MAVEPSNTASAVWHHLVALRDEIIHTLETEPREPATEQRLAAIEQQILETDAPSLGEVAFKLGLLWGEPLNGDDPQGRAQASILRDVRAFATSR
ncbi:hypothetical protein [Croceicoccus naphthovorans]|uniref:Uncharacterized protein n=1 Tax=Croceicoccus naphthovorans TaxID=1348774 RepID=A0A0G3XHE7_9SPHN|nr:hypothetical protein [Croceicoccus naphthovorans]AKM10995.1 hypothetical protein AB433_15105 [Croceicoccus naphthovorans]MBB3992342.1 hypothetical protein [Croceicoccus naphthovorans]